MKFFTLSGFRLCTTTLILLLISCGSNKEEDLEEVWEESTIALYCKACTGTWWEGYMHVRSEYNGAIYDASRTEIYFENDFEMVRKGKGYWIDHYNNAPWGSYFASHISWSVHEGIIDITFLDERDEHGNQVNMQIRDYYLSDNHFRGWVPATNGGERLEFDLRKVYHDDDYYNNYHYGWDDLLYDLLWSKPAAPGVTVERPAAPGTPKRVFE